MRLTVAPRCPVCQVRDGIRRILHGEPGQAVDESRFLLAPRSAAVEQRLWACVGCGWQVPAVVANVQEFAESVADSIADVFAESPLFDQDASDDAESQPEVAWQPDEGGFAVA